MRGALHCFLRRALRRHSTVATDAAASLMDRSSSSERYSYSPSLVWNPEVEAYFVKAYGADHFDRISKSLTHPSSYSCIRVNTLKTTTGEVIRKIRTILEEQRVISSSGCLNVNGENGALDVDRVLKEGSFNGGLGIDILLEDDGVRGDSDAIMMNIDRCSIDKCKYPSMDNVVIVRGSGPHLLQYNSQNKQPMKEIIVSRKCAESVLRGAQVFVPGVLACSAHVEKGDLVAVSVAVEQRGSDGGWGFGITRGTVLQGLHSDPQYCERNGLYIGQGIALMSRAGIFRASEGVAVEMTQRVYRLPSLHDVLEGEIFLQNLPSIVAAHVLDPQEGERILDMCAAPGGKTTAIAILMKDKGEVIAIDRSHNKVMDILKLAAEMGLTCINAYKLDALRSVCQAKEIVNVGVEDRDREATETVVEEAHGDIISRNPTKCCNIIDFMGNGHNAKADQRRCRGRDDNKKNTVYRKNGPGRNHCKGGRVRNSKGYAPNSFDRVLLDAPCSALGLRPRLFAGEETLESLRNHAKYQRRMFDRAVQLVRPGGVIVYSTCTINPGENEALVRYALDTYKFLSLAPQNPRIGGPGLVGGCELLDGKFVEEWLTESEAELVQRFDPSSSLDTIGFFIAKFRVGQEVQGELEERR